MPVNKVEVGPKQLAFKLKIDTYIDDIRYREDTDMISTNKDMITMHQQQNDYNATVVFIFIISQTIMYNCSFQANT